MTPDIALRVIVALLTTECCLAFLIWAARVVIDDSRAHKESMRIIAELRAELEELRRRATSPEDQS